MIRLVKSTFYLAPERPQRQLGDEGEYAPGVLQELSRVFVGHHETAHVR